MINNCYWVPLNVGGSGVHKIGNVSVGDLIIFARNGTGIITINSLGHVEMITSQGLSSFAYSDRVLSFSRTSTYSGDIYAFCRDKNMYMIS